MSSTQVFLFPQTDHKRIFSRKIILLLFLVCAYLLSGCGYNALNTQDEAVTAAWAEVVSQYKRRADLIPNLVKVVKSYASHEEEVFTAVTEARARMGTVASGGEAGILSNPAQFQQFQSAQAGMSQALGRLLAVSENYPELKADGTYRDLLAQLEGTENRIAVARGRYIKAVEKFNGTVRVFPSNLTARWFGFERKPNFQVENEKEISKAPDVDL